MHEALNKGVGPEPVDISRWGPAAWDFMYAVAFSYPDAPDDAHQRAAAAYFGSLPVLLPCARCRGHLGQYMHSFPIEAHVGSRAALASWLLNLNNTVNARIGKPALTMPAVWDRLVNNAGTERRRCIAAGACVLVAALGLAALLWVWCRARGG